MAENRAVEPAATGSHAGPSPASGMPSDDRRRLLKHAMVWVGFAVTGLFTYIAIRDVHFDETLAALRSMDYRWLAPGVALFALSIFIRALRWRYLFPVRGRPPLRPVVNALLIGYLFNTILPARAGEAARVIALRQRARTPIALSAGTVVVERVYDVLSLLLLLFLALPAFPHLSWIRAAAVLSIAIAVGVAVVIVVLVRYGDRPAQVLLRPLARLPFLTEGWVRHVAVHFTRGFAGLTSPRLVLGALGWTTASWVVMGLSFWALMLGFDLSLSPFAGLLVLIAIGLAMILPSAPAAVGVFEAATIVALSAYGVSNSVALSFALVAHAVQIVFYLATGLAALHVGAGALRRQVRVAEQHADGA